MSETLPSLTANGQKLIDRLLTLPQGYLSADAEDGERAVIVFIDDPGDLPAQHGALPGFESAHGRLLSSNSVRPSASNRRMNSSGWAFAQSSSMRGSGAGKVRRSTSRKSAPAVRRRSSQVS